MKNDDHVTKATVVMQKLPLRLSTEKETEVDASQRTSTAQTEVFSKMQKPNGNQIDGGVESGAFEQTDEQKMPIDTVTVLDKPSPSPDTTGKRLRDTEQKAGEKPGKRFASSSVVAKLTRQSVSKLRAQTIKAEMDRDFKIFRSNKAYLKLCESVAFDDQVRIDVNILKHVHPSGGLEGFSTEKKAIRNVTGMYNSWKRTVESNFQWHVCGMSIWQFVCRVVKLIESDDGDDIICAYAAHKKNAMEETLRTERSFRIAILKLSGDFHMLKRLTWAKINEAENFMAEAHTKHTANNRTGDYVQPSASFLTLVSTCTSEKEKVALLNQFLEFSKMEVKRKFDALELQRARQFELVSRRLRIEEVKVRHAILTQTVPEQSHPVFGGLDNLNSFSQQLRTLADSLLADAAAVVSSPSKTAVAAPDSQAKETAAMEVSADMHAEPVPTVAVAAAAAANK